MLTIQNLFYQAIEIYKRMESRRWIAVLRDSEVPLLRKYQDALSLPVELVVTAREAGRGTGAVRGDEEGSEVDDEELVIVETSSRWVSVEVSSTDLQNVLELLESDLRAAGSVEGRLPEAPSKLAWVFQLLKIVVLVEVNFKKEQFVAGFRALADLENAYESASTSGSAAIQKLTGCGFQDPQFDTDFLMLCRSAQTFLVQRADSQKITLAGWEGLFVNLLNRAIKAEGVAIEQEESARRQAALAQALSRQEIERLTHENGQLQEKLKQAKQREARYLQLLEGRGLVGGRLSPEQGGGGAERVSSVTEMPLGRLGAPAVPASAETPGPRAEPSSSSVSEVELKMESFALSSSLEAAAAPVALSGGGESRLQPGAGAGARIFAGQQVSGAAKGEGGPSIAGSGSQKRPGPGKPT